MPEASDPQQSVTVSVLAPGGELAWDKYVQANPASTFFHLSGWKRVIEKAFGHKTFYLVAKRGADICGILPLTQIKSLIFGNMLISNAFCVYGGIVANDVIARERLKSKALQIAATLKVEGVEFRSSPADLPSCEPTKRLYVTFRQQIAPDADANMKAIPRKQRAMVRKAMTNGLTAEIDDDVSRLHNIYAHSVRNLGTPVFSQRYFRILREEFGDACDVVTVLVGNRAIASVLNFYFRDEVLPYYGGGLPEARVLAGNDFMYWEVMRRACNRGYRIFDFGRSKIGTGSYNFKCNWGFTPIPLSYEYCPLNSRKVRDVNPLNPKYRLAIDIWRRLPLSITKAIGPAIVRSIG